jgi:histidinol-phosphatase (PHP family)
MENIRGYSCLHTHTVFCDGSDDVETFCQTAWEKGLCSLGFSAHAPIGKKTGIKSDWHLPDDRLEEYLDAVRTARSRWEGKLPIYLGLEVDFFPGLMGPTDKDYRDLDYLIGSVHYLIPPKGAPFTVDGSREELEQGLRESFDGDGEALMHAYWDAEAAMIRAGGFEILGHADLIKKNNRLPTGSHAPFFDPAGPGYCRRVEEITALAGTTTSGLVVEVNTGGLNRANASETYPSRAMLSLFQKHQIPALIAADAHWAKDLDGHYNEAREVMRKAGYTSQVFFEGKKDKRPQWRQEPL